MSQVTNEILEKLKTLTLLEAAELVSQIEKVFGVDVNASTGRKVMLPASSRALDSPTATKEKATFDVVLEFVEDNKRVAALKVIRSLTNLGLKEAKDFCSSLPKVVKESVSKEEAETAKKRLDEAGRKVVIQSIIEFLNNLITL